jgi:hypothetical protein
MLTDDVGFGAQSGRFGAVDGGKQTLVESGWRPLTTRRGLLRRHISAETA